MRKIYLATLIVLLSITVLGQDYHYWSEQFGAEAHLMGGAVVAGDRDNSAIFYNPGAVGFIKGNSVSVNANIYKVQLTRMNNSLGEDVNLKYNRYTFYPQMLSGMLQLFKRNNWKLSYGLFTRYNARMRFNSRYFGSINISDDFNGEENYVGVFDYNNEFIEQWGGIGIGCKINKNISIGVTQFVAYRYQTYRLGFSAKTIPVVDSSYFVSSISEYNDILYVNWRLIWKIGLALDYGKWKAGFTITTPSVCIYGDADVQREISFYNFEKLGVTIGVEDFLAIDRQDYLWMHYKTPLSVSAGLRYSTEKTNIEITAEYFAEIQPYDIIKAEEKPVVYPSEIFDNEIGSIKFVNVKGAANDVLNVAIGWQQVITDKFDFLCGFRTDFNNFTIQDELFDGIVMSGRTWNLYHITLGASWKKEKSKITAGFEYTYGRQKNIQQIVNFTNPTIENGTLGELNNNMTGIDHGIALVLGYTFYFSQLVPD
ncbi:OmpP1/FadL family transporter [Bacteroidota bacterium]